MLFLGVTAQRPQWMRRQEYGSGAGIPGLENPCSAECKPCDNCWNDGTKQEGATQCYTSTWEGDICKSCRSCDWSDHKTCEQTCSPCWTAQEACDPCLGDCGMCIECESKANPPPADVIDHPVQDMPEDLPEDLPEQPEDPCKGPCQDCDSCWVTADQTSAQGCYENADKSQECGDCNSCMASGGAVADCDPKCEACWTLFDHCSPCNDKCDSCHTCHDEAMPDPDMPAETHDEYGSGAGETHAEAPPAGSGAPPASGAAPPAGSGAPPASGAAPVYGSGAPPASGAAPVYGSGAPPASGAGAGYGSY